MWIYIYNIGRGIKAETETYGLYDVFHPDDLGSGPYI